MAKKIKKDPLEGKRFYVIQDGTIPPKKIAEFFKKISVPNKCFYTFEYQTSVFFPNGLVYFTKYEPLMEVDIRGLFVSAVFKADKRHIKDFKKYQRLVYDKENDTLKIK